MNDLIILRLEFRAAIREQELDERVQELDVAFGGLKGKRVHTWPVFAHPVYASAVQLGDALIAAADVEDVGEAAVLLFKSDELIAMNLLARPRGSDDEHDANAVHIHVLEERSPR